jgi:hypothetical protein
MLVDVTSVRPLSGHRLHLRFADGVEGTVEVTRLVKLEGVFGELREWDAFAAVRVDPELGTVTWPNGADLDPDVLYAQVTGKPLPDFSETEGTAAAGQAGGAAR